MNGILRGKRVAARTLETIYRRGVCLPRSLLGDGIRDEATAYAEIGAKAEPDLLCRPVPGSLRRVPWRERPTAQVLLAMEEPDGAPTAAYPRQVLRRVVERFHALGLVPVLAVELEFYLLAAEPGPDGRPQVASNPVTGRSDRANPAWYMLQELDDHQRLLEDILAACHEQRVPAETAISEAAPGQLEINLRHRPDAVAACDDAIYMKRAIKAVAERHGQVASFMAKPFADLAGSGLHVHVSLLGEHGRNVFAGPEGSPCEPLHHAIGGLRASRDDCTLLFAPHANSYRRIAPGAGAPVHGAWGYNNRAVALRIPCSAAEDRRIEHRAAGADANPYLVAAAVLAGILDGLERCLDPGPPVVGDPQRGPAAARPHWRGALERFEASEFVVRQFGGDFCRIYGQQKRSELHCFEREISDVEYAWYLRVV